MNILLITPLAGYTPTRWLPLGMSYIASMLQKNDHIVMLYDRFLRAHILGNKEAVNFEMKSEILNFRPDIIGFSTVTPLIYDTLECVNDVRNYYDGIIIAGGHHATAMPEDTLKKIPGLDFVAAGESEYTVLDLADGKEHENIKGLFYKNIDSSIFQFAQVSNLDELPQPDYKIFDTNYYTSENSYTVKGFYLKTAPVLSSRGCVNNCKFCTESLTYGKGLRFHSTDYVIENIERLTTDYKVNGIYFSDNNFLSSFSHAENICKEIISRNLNKKIKWAIQASTKSVNNELLSLLAKAGCVKIEFGMESVKDSFIDSMDKHTTVALNEKALSLCRNNGIKAHSYFMTGFKNESMFDLDNTLLWIKKFKPHTFSLHQLSIYPGTSLYEDYGNMFFEKNDWTKNNIENYFKQTILSKITRVEKENWRKKTFKPFYTSYYRKALIKANPLVSILKMAFRKYFVQNNLKNSVKLSRNI
ncbi:MAG: B12-binding domain-containing radical SAM protein [Candidatus Humimicrobiaceae bacterium]